MRALVIGLGRLGLPLARTLTRRGWEVIGIDTSPKCVDRAKQFLSFCARADAMDESALREVIGKGIDLGFIAIGNSLEASVHSVVLLRESGVKQIIARANNDREARVLTMVGATRAIQVEAEMGERLGKGIMSGGVLDFMPLDGDAALVEWKPSENFWGKSLEELALRRTYGINVAAIWSSQLKRWDFVPSATDLIHQGDVLLIIGPEPNVDKLTKPAGK